MAGECVQLAHAKGSSISKERRRNKACLALGHSQFSCPPCAGDLTGLDAALVHAPCRVNLPRMASRLWRPAQKRVETTLMTLHLGAKTS